LEKSQPLITLKDAHQIHAAPDEKSSEFIACQLEHHKSRKLKLRIANHG
jgi:hypothetical protein